jgi:hypothetical protein
MAIDMNVTLTVYNGRTGDRVAQVSHDFADIAALADVLMMHYAQRSECIVDFANGEYLTTTLARMDYLDSHYAEGAVRRELVAAIEKKLSSNESSIA